jgi:aminopeptidase N
MKKILIPIFAALIVFAYSCGSSKKTNKIVNAGDENIPEIELGELPITATPIDTIAYPDDLEIPVYRASATRTHDLIHTKLDLRFDWQKERVNGKAILTLKSYFYASDELVLDAKNFDIQSIELLNGKNTALKYEYNNEQITIHLDKKYSKNEEYKVAIQYVAKPSERKNIGGSQAITSDKGLYFINPRGEELEKPTQIWTQGETESNSCWFPTVDKPNERCTGEITLTVEDKYKTLSNGLMTTSVKNADGTRTDTWKMDQPHAPYLFMIAVGEFAVVKDKWENIDLAYYVEPKFEKDARAIFPHTPELLDFFSKKLGVKYPWQKYSQIIVRDYVSGAMENTTAVIFGEYMQNSERDLIDVETNESVVAHEMFHHWFGDYVTTESWSNLTLNEGFANYSEYLWLEHKYGKDAAQAHWKTELEGYLGQARGQRHALINFTYGNREDMFDAHSYNKGGIILHMLRTIIGDDAFFTALNQYLTKHAYTDVEVHELRMAFEEVTGQDLNWFFNQWYLNSGHPELEVSKRYDAVTGKLVVTVAQKQDGKNNLPVYQLPIAIDVYYAEGEKPQRFNITTKQRKEVFTFNVAKAPKLVNFDAERVTLCQLDFPKTEDEYIFQYNNAPLYLDRLEAIEAFQGMEKPTEAIMATLKKAMSDSHYSIRGAAINMLDISDASIAEMIENAALNDKHSEVRGSAMFRLGQTENKKYAETAKKVLDKEHAFLVISEALQALYVLDKESALKYLPKLENEDSPNIVNALAVIYSENPTPERIAFFDKKIKTINGMDAIGFIGSYATMCSSLNDEIQEKCIKTLQTISMSMDDSPWRRYGAVKGLSDLKMIYKALNNTAKMQEVAKIVDEAKSKETNSQLKAIYEMF